MFNKQRRIICSVSCLWRLGGTRTYQPTVAANPYVRLPKSATQITLGSNVILTCRLLSRSNCDNEAHTWFQFRLVFIARPRLRTVAYHLGARAGSARL